MTSKAQLVRQWQLLQVLSVRRQAATIRELAAEMDVVDKSIRRDLDFLRGIGFPIFESVGPYGRKSWKLDSAKGIPVLNFNLTEVLSLYLARRFLEPLAGTNVWAGAQSAIAKIRAILGDTAAQYFEKLAEVLQPTPIASSDYSQHSDIIERLLISIEDHRITWIVYHSLRSTEPVSTEVYPLRLLWHRGSLYLLAHAREDGKIKTYKVDRISGVDPTDLRFAEPQAIDIDDVLAKSFGIMTDQQQTNLVQVRFDLEVARFVREKTWHRTQKLTSQKDGSIIAEFELGNLKEFKTWILSFGQHAEILQPISLRKEMEETVQAMQQLYQPKKMGKASNPKTPRGLPR